MKKRIKKDSIIVDVDTSFGNVMVYISGNSGFVNYYDVVVDGKVKHPRCTAEDAMRALGHYLEGK